MKKYSSQEIRRIISRNIILILVFALAGTASFLGVAKHKRTTEYIAHCSVMISHDLNHSNSKAKQTTADLNRIKSYEDVIEDPAISRQAHKYLNHYERKEVSVEELNHGIKVSSNFNSLVLTISGKAASAKLATNMVNSTAKAAQEKLPVVVPDAGQVIILSKAKNSEAISHTRPSYKKYGVVGFAFGALVGMVIAFVWTSWQQLLYKK